MCKRITLVCLSTQIINKISLYFGVDLIAFYNCHCITYIEILYPFIRCHPALWVGHNEFENVSLLSHRACCYIYFIQTNSCALFKTHSHLKPKILKIFVKHIIKTLHVSVTIVWLSSDGRLSCLVLLLLFCLFASSSCLFGMWHYVVCVCACLMYFSVGCLVHNQTTHREVHQARTRTHIQNTAT
jgi:hypothetical protein